MPGTCYIGGGGGIKFSDWIGKSKLMKYLTKMNGIKGLLFMKHHLGRHYYDIVKLNADQGTYKSSSTVICLIFIIN